MCFSPLKFFNLPWGCVEVTKRWGHSIKTLKSSTCHGPSFVTWNVWVSLEPMSDIMRIADSARTKPPYQIWSGCNNDLIDISALLITLTCKERTMLVFRKIRFMTRTTISFEITLIHKGRCLKLSIFPGECDDLYSKKTYLKYFVRHLMSMIAGRTSS